MRRLLREQEQAGALPAALTILRDANPVRPGRHRPGWVSRSAGSTIRVARRVANFGSEVPALTRREHGATPWQPTNFEGRGGMKNRGRSFSPCVGLLHHDLFLLYFQRSRSSITRARRFERRRCRWESCRECHFCRVSPISKRRPAQNGKVGGANPSRGTNLRPLP